MKIHRFKATYSKNMITLNGEHVSKKGRLPVGTAVVPPDATVDEIEEGIFDIVNQRDERVARRDRVGYNKEQ